MSGKRKIDNLKQRYVAHCNKIGVSTETAIKLFSFHKHELIDAYRSGYRIGKNGTK